MALSELGLVSSVSALVRREFDNGGNLVSISPGSYTIHCVLYFVAFRGVRTQTVIRDGEDYEG